MAKQRKQQAPVSTESTEKAVYPVGGLVSLNEKKLLEKAARLVNRSVSNLIRTSTVAAAKEIIHLHESERL